MPWLEYRGVALCNFAQSASDWLGGLSRDALVCVQELPAEDLGGNDFLLISGPLYFTGNRSRGGAQDFSFRVADGA